MKRKLAFSLYSLAVFLCACSYMAVTRQPLLLLGIIPVFLFIFVFAGGFVVPTKNRQLWICHHGGILLVAFLLSLVLSFVYHVILAVWLIPTATKAFLWSLLVCVCVEALVFWNGILCVYLTSTQLGIRQRVIGAICGMIPIANLIALNGILRTVFREVDFEMEKERVDKGRKDARLCETKYPILLVHGVFFRDSNFFNYWGRIPKALEKNGAKIYYGNHQSAASVACSAEELTARIREILAETGCEKVNIIAHSKGGLDCRYAMHYLGAAPMVASLTTINTPHRGCIFADFLLKYAPEKLKNSVATTYNQTLRQFGDQNPDFLAAVNDLTASACTVSDSAMPAPSGVFCQSVGSWMERARSGKFPLNFSFHLVKFFDGPNDGLVSLQSFSWGEKYTLVTVRGDRGISHGDMVDLNRENIDGFDVREFYVNLVSELKKPWSIVKTTTSQEVVVFMLSHFEDNTYQGGKADEYNGVQLSGLLDCISQQPKRAEQRHTFPVDHLQNSGGAGNQQRGSSNTDACRGNQACGGRAQSIEGILYILALSELIEDCRNDNDDQNRGGDQTQCRGDSAEDCAGDAMNAIAGDEANIGGHVYTNRTWSGFAHGDHIGKLGVGKPAGFVGHFIQERDGSHAAANGEQAGHEKFQKQTQVDHAFFPPKAFSTMPTAAASTT